MSGASDKLNPVLLQPSALIPHPFSLRPLRALCVSAVNWLVPS